MVEQVAAMDGFDGQEQAQQACTLRPFAVGVSSNRLPFRVWVNRNPAQGDPVWVIWQTEGAPVSTYVPFQDTAEFDFIPADCREDWIGD